MAGSANLGLGNDWDKLSRALTKRDPND